MRRKQHEADHEDMHRWVISYADFITLLFAFFVVMYAISSVNISKYRRLTQGMENAFNKNQKVDMLYLGPTQKPGKSSILLKQATSTEINSGDAGLNAVAESLSNLQDKDLKIKQQDGWIEVDIKAGSLFDEGSADLRPTAMVKIMKLAQTLAHLPYPIAIEGYTDNVPIMTNQFPSNWDLSSARASVMARELTNFGMVSNALSVTGYGEQYPKDDNKTPEGRANNRRVNIIIAKDRTVQRLLNPAFNPKSMMKSSVNGLEEKIKTLEKK